jgi:hypothetical protein
MSSKFKPTKEQLSILETFKTTRVLKVNAIAGSGKTSTLELLAEDNLTPSLLLAFNKSIAEDAASRFPSHVSCRTINSLAYADFGKPLQHKLNPNKNPKVNTMRSIKDIVDWYGLEDFTEAVPLISARTIASLSRDVVDRFCYSARPSISELDLSYSCIKDLERNHKFDSKYFGKILINLAKLIWQERKDPLSQAWCTHDTYMKLWSLNSPKLNYDIVYVDECQDINPCVLHVLEQQTCKILYVGDQYQSIYAFRGTTNAMKKIEAPTMHLSQSWRYGEDIAQVAEMILSKDGVVVKGNPSIKSNITKVTDMQQYTMIFRTNTALLTEAQDLVKKGKKISVQANIPDFIRQLKSVINLLDGKKPYHDSIARFTNWKDLVDFAKESVDIKRLIDIALLPDVDKFIQRLESINSCTDPDIILTTAHKSKGLEYDNVVIAEDFKFGKESPLDIPEQEVNLIYVACTRARNNLELPSRLEDLLT